METNMTIQQLQNYNFCERNHWQLMADLSNNDYDISYFGGRVAICDEFDFLLQTQEDNFDIKEIIEWLVDNFEDTTNQYVEYFKENKVYNPNYKGVLDEIELLIRIVAQDYDEIEESVKI